MTPADHADLTLAHDLMAWASKLVNSVLERNRLDTPLQAISLLSGAKQDADLSVAMVDSGDLASASSHVRDATREIDMAERYMNWKAGA